MKHVNIYDIADMAGVSVTTVTRAFKKDAVINPETRERILRIAAAHNYRPNLAAGRISQKSIVIGVLLEDCSENLFHEMEIGFRDAHRERSDYKVELELRAIRKEAISEESCLSAFRELEALGIGGLILSLQSYPHSLVETVNRAVEECGLAVVTMISVCPDIRQVFSIHTQASMVGRVAAELLDILVANDRSVAVFLGNSQIDLHREILQGFSEEADRSSLPIASIFDFHEDMELARRQTRELLDSMPDVGGIFVSSANSSTIIEEITRRGATGKVRIVATDLYPPIAADIRAGTVSATIYKDPYGQAKLTFERLYQYLSGHLREPTDVYIKPRIVLRSNLEAYTRENVLFSEK